jgi:hypothetical protein
MFSELKISHNICNTIEPVMTDRERYYIKNQVYLRIQVEIIGHNDQNNRKEIERLHVSEESLADYFFQ